MGAANISVNKLSQDVLRDGLIYDVKTRGLDSSFWKTLAATASVVSDKIRITSGGEIASYMQFKHGKFKFALNVPTTPSAGEAKKWGLLNPGSATTGAMYFEITGATFRAVSYDDSGTAQTTTVTWSGEGAETVFEIEWGVDYVIFKRSGTAVATHQTRVGQTPLPLYLINSDADNTDLGYIIADEVGASIAGGTEQSSGLLSIDAEMTDDSAFTVGTDEVIPTGFLADETSPDSVNEGDVGIPRMTLNRRLITADDYAEDTGHTTGDYGSAVLGVRNDANAALSGTDLDYTPISVDSAGNPQIDVLSVIPGTAATNLGKAEDAAHVTGDTGVMALSVRQDTAAALAGTDADYQPLITDAEGRQHVTNVVRYISSATYSPSRFADLGANATANVKATAGNVFSLWCHNENAADRYIQLHNTATTPGGGATPLFTFLVPAGGQIVIGTDFFTDAGARFSTGIAFAFSTTKDTYTAGAAGDQSTLIMFA